MSSNETFDRFWDSAPPSGLLNRVKSFARTKACFSARIRLDIYCLAEILVVAALGYAVSSAYVGGALGVEHFLDRYIWPVLALPATMGMLLRRSGLYEISALTEFAGNLGRVASGVAGAFVSFAVVGIILGVSDDYSRVWFGGWLTGSLLALWLMRAIAAGMFRRWIHDGVLLQRAAIFGEGPLLERYLARFDRDNPHMEIVGVFSEQRNQPKPGARQALTNLVEQGRNAAFDVVIIVPPYDDPAALDHILNAVSMLSMDIKVVPPPGLTNIPLLGVSRQGPYQFLDVQRSSISDWGRIFKRLEDCAFAICGLALLSWLMLLIAGVIRLESKGPVLYRQWRTGLNNREFRIYKFRTMTTEPASASFRQAQRDDQRITPFGRFLRRTSLDELPQLLNVLKGEMSIVGPRPHPVELNRTYAPQVHLFNKRHSVKPGITGWAQIHDHRGPTLDAEAMRQRLLHDLHYVDNWSIWFDLKIMAATPFMSLIHRNAY